ncbi:DUF2141 domain-containing protein [Aurantiacibacter spongiae]|uniref:DUF2141 domain-containing protein n=1 Tax=Aurantiacibacter spongiae TaxID=2488860 RepID=UPI0015F2D402|nr:DUF2141 domain-containing protein [Aurantiacibacter spongiae]
MPNRPRTFRTLTFVTASLVLAGFSTPLAADPARTGGTEVIVEVTNLRSGEGTVRACMTADPERFPRCRDDARSFRVVVPASQAHELHFRGVSPGRYAIALLHDENDNGRADRALGMMPKEGFGFSRDAPVRMGPPKFDEAAIAVGETAQHRSIRMRYML